MVYIYIYIFKSANSANLPSLSNRRLQDIAVLVYKVNNSLCPIHINEIFNKSTNHYELRNANFNISRYNAVK